MNPIILFDIDQTLLYSGGAGGLAMRRAFHQLYGIEDGFRRVEFSGRTDWAILRAAMAEHGVPAAHDNDAFVHEMRRFQDTYFALLRHTLHEVDGGRAMPGVAPLLDRLARQEGVRLGLATGNFRGAAFIKLDFFALDDHLTDGGFGDDAEDRAHVVRAAIQRVGGDGASGAPVWIVGDTPLDIAAAHANGARALGVATGPCTTDELLAAGADAALPDLSDTDAVLTTLLSE